MRARRSLRLVLSLVLGLAALVFLWFSTESSLKSGGMINWPPSFAIAIAYVATAVGMWAASSAWTHILGAPGRGHRADFLTAQLAKYIPGGVWQPAGQVGLSATREVPAKKTISALGAHALAQITSGALLFPFLLFDSVASALIRALAVAIAIAAALGIWLINTQARRRIRLPVFAGVQSQISAASRPRVVFLLVVNMALQGVSFALIAGPSGGLSVIGAYSAAWIAGFLAVPVPAGLGIRELVLMTLLPIGAAQIVAASLVQRLVAAVADISLVLFYRVLR